MRLPRAAAGSPRLWGEGIDLLDDRGHVAVILAGGGHREGAVAGLEDDNGGHQGGGEAEGEGVGVVR
ncbi:hypothetical protein [Sinorhizobium meliloti]|uniref:hypothetical protein n=1 Tax=Rhizobium meliloti TaxID=382 RepID=UPI0013E3187D|nr:hypothetical protein [Sinorhizobium meliloti]